MNPFSMAGGAAQSFIASLVGATQASNKLAYAQQQTIQMTQQASRKVSESFMQVADAGFKAGGAAKTMGGAFDIMLTSIGTAFTPVLFSLSIAFINLANEISDKLVPAIREWYNNLNSNARSGGRSTGEGVGLIGGGVAGAKVGAAVGSLGGPPGALIGGIVGMIGGALLGKSAGGAIGEKLGNAATGGGYNLTGNIPGGPGAADRANRETGLEVLREMKMNLGRQGQVGFSGIADVWKQVQMKSFMSPFEQIQLKLLTKQIEIAEQQLARMNPSGGVDAEPVGRAVGEIIKALF